MNTSTIPVAADGGERKPHGNGLSAPFALLLVAILAVDAGFFLWALSGDGYAPSASDEFGYVGEAVSFSLFGDFKAPGTYYEQLSSWGECGFHGPVYAAVDGIAAWLTGWKWNFKLLVNVLATLGGLLLAWVGFRPMRERRSMALVVVLTGFVLPIYLFTYMQEAVQIPIAVAGAMLFLRSERQAPRGAELLVWSAVGLLAGFVRLTWVFLAAPLPLVTRRSWRLAGALAALSVIALAFLASSRLIAPFPGNWLTKTVEQARGEGLSPFVVRVGRHLADNLAMYFRVGGNLSAAYVGWRYWMLLLFSGALALGWRLRRPSMLAGGVLGMLTWLTVCTLYDVTYWRDQRVLAPCALTCALTIVASAPRSIAATVTLVSATFWLAAATEVVPTTIREHKGAASAWNRHASRVERLRELALALPAGEESVVLVPPGFPGDVAATLGMPIAGPESRRIRYTANYMAPTLAETYVRHGRMPVRFAIARPEQVDPEWPVLATVDGWTLFRLPDSAGDSDRMLGRRMAELERDRRDAQLLQACEVAWKERGRGEAVVTAVQTLLQRREERECRVWLDRGLAEEPDSPQLLLLDGLLRTRSGDDEGALQSFGRSARDPVREPACRIEIGRIYIRRGEWTDAGESFRRALELHPDDPTALVGLAEVLAEAGQVAEGRTLYIKAVERGFPDPEIALGSGRFLEKIGELDAARLQYERALALDPKHPEARKRLHRIRSADEADSTP